MEKKGNRSGIEKLCQAERRCDIWIVSISRWFERDPATAWRHTRENLQISWNSWTNKSQTFMENPNNKYTCRCRVAVIMLDKKWMATLWASYWLCQKDRSWRVFLTAGHFEGWFALARNVVAILLLPNLKRPTVNHMLKFCCIYFALRARNRITGLFIWHFSGTNIWKRTPKLGRTWLPDHYVK
jgi:hypothetical protein